MSMERLTQAHRIERERALEILRARAFSTFELLPPDEYQAGVIEAEKSLPAETAYDYHWLLATASV